MNNNIHSVSLPGITVHDEDVWFEMFLLRIHTLDASVFSTLARIHTVDVNPQEVMDGLLLYSASKDRYVIDRRQMIDIIRKNVCPGTENFQERLNQLIEVVSVGSVRNRMYMREPDRIHLRTFTETVMDEGIPILAKQRLDVNVSIRQLHREVARRRMRGFSSPSDLRLRLDRQITMVLSQEACFSSRGEEYALSLIRH